MPGRKLSKAQRAQLIAWIRAGDDDYRTVSALMEQHGFPPVSRQAVNFYKQRYAKRSLCQACGQMLPATVNTAPA